MAMEDGVRVRLVNESMISPAPDSDPLETSRNVKLSFFDIHWICLPPVQRIILFETDTSFHPSIVENMRTSLSVALRHFRPLAGKLIYSAESNEMEIECSGNDTIVFLEAESDVDFRQLAEHDVHEAVVFRELVPKMDVSVLPAPLFSVQVTRICDAGVAVGVTIHHVAVDGKGLWQFLKSWAAICRTRTNWIGPSVSWDRSMFRDSFGLEFLKFYQQMLTPSLPKLTIVNFSDQDPKRLMQKTFILTSAKVHSLKARASQAADPGAIPISTFVAVSAHTWICAHQARSKSDNDETVLLTPIDCRPHLRAGECYFGNCVRPCRLRARSFQLLGENGFGYATMEIQRVIREAVKEPLKDAMDWMKYPFELPPSFLTVVSSPRFKVYETDFGFGRPTRVELVSMNSAGSVILADSRDEPGGLQVSVALSPIHMEKFSSLFLDLL